MMTRSAPPFSANFAESPMPAPAAMTGRPASSVFVSRSRTSFREYFIAALLSNELKKAMGRLSRECIAVDVGVQLDQRDVRGDVLPERGEQRFVGLGIVEGLALDVDGGDTLFGDHEHRRPFRLGELRGDNLTGLA